MRSIPISAELREIKENIRKVKIESLLDAKDLTSDEYDTLNVKKHKTQDEILSIQKQYVKMVYETPQLTKEFLEKNLKHVNGYANYKQSTNKPLDNLIEEVITKHENQYDKRVYDGYLRNSLNNQENNSESEHESDSGSDKEIDSESDQETCKFPRERTSSTMVVFKSQAAKTLERIQAKENYHKRRAMNLESVSKTVFNTVNFNKKNLKLKTTAST